MDYYYTLPRAPVLLAIAATVVLAVISWLLLFHDARSSKSPKKIVYPPGKTGLPLVGDTLGFINALATDRLKPFLDAKAAKYGPLFTMSVFGGTVVVMDPPAGIKFFFVNEHKLFETYWAAPFARLLGKDSVALKLGEEHRTCRRHLANTFLGPDIVWKFVDKVEALALKNLEEHWKEDEDICTYKLIRGLTFNLICQLCMSASKQEADELLEGFDPWVAGLIKLPINLPGFAYHRAVKARAVLHHLLDRKIMRRRKELEEGTATATQDLLSALLTQQDEQEHMYTASEIKDNLQFLLAAGHETSSSVLTLTIRNIAKHPEVYKALIEEHARIAAKKQGNDLLTAEDVRSMEYTWRVVQETMRVTPVVNLGMRIATVDFQYNGFTIPKGWKILWCQDLCSKEATYFDNPNNFDPSRFERRNPAPYTYLPFGAGSRVCPGSEFAKMEILVFLHHLLKRFKWSIVDPNEEMVRKFVPMTKRGSLVRATAIKAF